MNLNDETMVAVAKVIKKAALKDARNALDPGTYNINATMRLQGSIKVGENEEYTPTTSLPIIGVLALVLRHCGVTRDAALAAVERISEAAIMDFTKVGDACDEAGSFMQDMTRKVCSMTENLPKKERDGKVTTKLDVQLVRQVA